jgi:hypothetical protein
MTSKYSSDPRVPPAQVGHLGKRRPSGADHEAGEQDHSAADGPSYADFLEQEAPEVDAQGETG